MVERAGQRVAPGRLDELEGLAGQPSLGGPEDEEQQDRRRQRRAEGDDDDVAADIVEPREDRDAVAPKPDDPDNVPVDVCDRQALTEDPGTVEVHCGRARLGQRHDRNVRSGVECGRGSAGIGCGRDGGEQRAVGSSELGVTDPIAPDEGAEFGLERGPPRGVDGSADREVGRGQAPGLAGRVCEAPDGRNVSANDALDGDRGEVGRDHRGLRGGRDPHDGEERAEDEQQQDRAANPPLTTEHGQHKTPSGRRRGERTGPSPHSPPDLRTNPACNKRVSCPGATGPRRRFGSVGASATWRPRRPRSPRSGRASRACACR